jgi:hypothetical protein
MPGRPPLGQNLDMMSWRDVCVQLIRNMWKNGRKGVWERCFLESNDLTGPACVSFRDDSVDIRGKLEPRVTRSTGMFQQSYQIEPSQTELLGNRVSL